MEGAQHRLSVWWACLSASVGSFSLVLNDCMIRAVETLTIKMTWNNGVAVTALQKGCRD